MAETIYERVITMIGTKGRDGYKLHPDMTPYKDYHAAWQAINKMVKAREIKDWCILKCYLHPNNSLDVFECDHYFGDQDGWRRRYRAQGGEV